MELLGAFEDFDFNSHQPYPLVLGFSSAGTKITLLDCTVTNLTMGVPGLSVETYKIRYCFLGAHFNDLRDVVFARFAVRYSHLSDWVRTSGFSVTRSGAEHKIKVEYALPPDIEAQTSRGAILVSFVCNTNGDGIEQLNLHQTVSLEGEADREYALEDLLRRYIQPLLNLLTLATATPNTILELNVFAKDVYFDASDGERIETPIQVFFQQRYFVQRKSELLVPHKMLFSYQDIAEDFQSLIERWFDTSEELESVCNLFFGVQASPALNLENRFLNFVQAIETYHRRRMKNEVLPKSDHKALISRILDQVHPEHRDWLKGLLTYSNEPRLEQRLRELTTRVNDAIAPRTIGADQFAKRVKGKAARGSELFWLAQTVNYLLQACFLLELGISVERSGVLLQRHHAFISTIDKLAEWTARAN